MYDNRIARMFPPRARVYCGVRSDEVGIRYTGREDVEWERRGEFVWMDKEG